MTDTTYNQNKNYDTPVDETPFDADREIVETRGPAFEDSSVGTHYPDEAERISDAQWADESPATANVGDLPPVPEAAPHDPALAPESAFPAAAAVPGPAPVADDELRSHSLEGDTRHDGDTHHLDSDSEIIRIKHLEDETDKPWTIEFVNIPALKKARAILNYPVHRFETEEKAREVAQMLGEIIRVDAVVEADGGVDPVTEDEKPEFFHNLQAPDKL